VRVNKGQLLGAVFAAMSVQWTVARSVGLGVIKDRLPFVRTAKGGLRRTADFHAFWEAVLASLLLLGAAVLVSTNIKEIREIYIFAAVVVVQSIPFIAAAALAAIERTPLNDYATWRTMETRLAELLGRQASMPIAPAVAVAPAPASVPAVQPAAPAQSQSELVS
jgi:hypothetical protein